MNRPPSSQVPESQQQYSNPPIPLKTKTVYNKYQQMRYRQYSGRQNEQQMIIVDEPNLQDYPKLAQHSRFPVLINCQTCHKLAMTQVQHEHGWSSKIWCLLLLPVLCTGMCCLCLNSCKDIKHSCGYCRTNAGVCKSSFC